MKKKYLITLTIILTFLIYNTFNDKETSALILDPINGDPDFKDKTHALLEENGYKVACVSGENVTIELLKNLPEGHDLYIFRVHSTCIHNRTWIFSGEKYRKNKYPVMQMRDQIHKARPSPVSDHYFAVSPEFIQEYNQDAFKDSIILMMGCQGITRNDLATAFCQEGAAYYISWDGNVCLEHTDKAFIALIEALYKHNMPLMEAVQHTKKTIGMDPVYHSSLKSYPDTHLTP